MERMLAILGSLLAEHDEFEDGRTVEHPDVETERVSVLSGVSSLFILYSPLITGNSSPSLYAWV